MTATEFNLLWELAHNAGRVMTYDTLITRVWDDESIYDTGALRKVVKNLRAKLGDNARNPDWIFTLHRVGYRLGR